jgi:benzoyl-CoA 2,3-dioxygenase component B
MPPKAWEHTSRKESRISKGDKTVARISTFDDWTDYFRQWQTEIGLDTSKFDDYKFEVKFGDVGKDIVEFGDYAGRPKWETVLQIPDQRVRDTLLHLITYQGDTEFASVEQQRNLLKTAPSVYDLQSAVKIMREEMRHGTQMSYLLVKYFGSSGKLEAQKLLERRAFSNSRLLGAFNQDVQDWLDFYCYTELVDRDGKYQLTMLSHSGFKPLAASMKPMLQEEFFHLLTGHTGLSRVLKAGKVPVELIQKHINKWFSVALDLFGVDNSSSAYWFYVWGLKGRYDEGSTDLAPDRDRLNELSRDHYLKEVRGLMDALNKLIPEDRPKLTLPDAKFHRSIGEFAEKTYDVHGNLLSPESYAEHLREVLPGPEDKVRLAEIFKQPDWVLAV